MKKLKVFTIAAIVGNALLVAVGCSVTNKKPKYSSRDLMIIRYTDSAVFAEERGRSDSARYWIGVALNVDSVIAANGN